MNGLPMPAGDYTLCGHRRRHPFFGLISNLAPAFLPDGCAHPFRASLRISSPQSSVHPGAIHAEREDIALRWLGLILWLLACFAVAGAGARWNVTEIPGWYRTLARPSFTPPDRVFGPVWTLLYLLMAIAAWRISLAPPSAARTVSLFLFVVQLALNLAWSWIFFRKHAIGAALGEIVLLWMAIGATTLGFGRLSPPAAWLMAPYWAWVSFAAILNGAFWRLNR